MKVHSPFTVEAHWSRINAMDGVNLFVSSKVNYCHANKGEALLSFGVITQEKPQSFSR